ncbi:MAG: cell division protein FtsA [Dehalococcoidales bacterium]|nr:cell division protein FtsA [Dehalococcoidales bacterium]
MKKLDGVAAIDVGTTKVCTILAENGPDGLKTVGVGITPSRGMHKGMVVNIDEAAEAIYQSVKKAEETCNLKVESAYIGVTGRHVTSMNNHGVISINRNDRLVRPDDLRRVLNATQSVKVASDRKLLHVIPRSYGVDGQCGVRNPVGMHGTKLDVETHIITATQTSLQNMVKCIRKVGVEVEDLVLEPLASAEAVLTEEEKHDGVVLADIGGGTTDIAIFREGSIWHTAVLPVAGYQLTRDIGIGLGLPFDVAEQMKKKYGSVMSVYEGKSEAAAEIAADGHGFSYQDLCGILRARVEELIKLVRLEICGDEAEKLAPAGLVFTGGSSNLSGLAPLASQMLGLPVRIGSPVGMVGLTDALNDPAYATSVGLMLWGAKHQGRDDWKSPRISIALRHLAVRLRNMFH